MSKAANDRDSLFSYVDEAIEDVFRPSIGKLTYSNLTAAKQLSSNHSNVDATLLGRRIYDEMLANWEARKPKERKLTISSALWGLRRRRKIRPDKKGFEVHFERNLAGLCEFYDKLNPESKAAITWYNQVPIAKGLVSNGEKLNAVDLVYRRAADKFDFVELKTPPRPAGGNHPVYAAMEVLKYGLAFLLFVSKLSEIQEAGWKPVDEDETLKGWVLNAVEVNLCVLAPESYYKGFDFGWLEDQLNVGLGQLPDTPKTALNHMTFRYQALSNSHSNAAAADGLLLGLGRVSLSQDDWARLSKEASTSEGKPPKR